MIGYFTDNSISQAVMNAINIAGITTAHIKKFGIKNGSKCIFYGILRGTGSAIKTCEQFKKNVDYYYLDNGYFDAVYMDASKHKEMTGKYRVVKNDLIEPYTGEPNTEERRPLKILILPPTPYMAFMYDTTPEDWLQEWTGRCSKMGDSIKIRDKDHTNPVSLSEQLKDYDALLTFNSMSAMTAIKMGKAVYTTHGIVRNSDQFEKSIPYYDYRDMQEFYQGKQYTLEEIKQGAVQWN